MKPGHLIFGVFMRGVFGLGPIAAAQTPEPSGTQGQPPNLPLSQFETEPLTADQMNDAVRHIEATMKMPNEAASLSRYGRYYAQDKGIIYGELIWIGDFTKEWTLGVHIVRYKDLPLFVDGGCYYIDVMYVPKIQSLDVQCHG